MKFNKVNYVIRNLLVSFGFRQNYEVNIERKLKFFLKMNFFLYLKEILTKMEK